MSQQCTFFLDPRKCKQRWESLRAQFRKHIRGQKTKTGQAASFQTKWKYEDHMEFLRAYMKDKVRITSVTGENEDPSFIADEEDENDTLTQISEPPTPPTPQIAKASSSVLRKRKIPVAATETASSTLMKHILEEEKKLKKEEPKSEMDVFFDSIRMTVNKFNPYDKFLAKQKIFQIVTEIEAKYMDQYWNQPTNYQITPQQQFTDGIAIPPSRSTQHHSDFAPSHSTTRPSSVVSSVPTYHQLPQQQFTHSIAIPPTTSIQHQSYFATSPSISTRPSSAASSVQETPPDSVASSAASFLETFSP